MFIKKKKIFNYQNQIILTNGSTLQILSVKYIKNFEINQTFLKDFKNFENKNIIKENNFLKKLKKN